MALPAVKTVEDCDKRLVKLRSERIQAIGNDAVNRVQFLNGEIDEALEQRLKLAQNAAVVAAAR